jgi:hypothetical protein
MAITDTTTMTKRDHLPPIAIAAIAVRMGRRESQIVIMKRNPRLGNAQEIDDNNCWRIDVILITGFPHFVLLAEVLHPFNLDHFVFYLVAQGWHILFA